MCGEVINIGERKESLCVRLFVLAEVTGKWMHANVHVLCTVHACMGLAIDADKDDTFERWKESNKTLLNAPCKHHNTLYND